MHLLFKHVQLKKTIIMSLTVQRCGLPTLVKPIFSLYSPTCKMGDDKKKTFDLIFLLVILPRVIRVLPVSLSQRIWAFKLQRRNPN